MATLVSGSEVRVGDGRGFKSEGEKVTGIETAVAGSLDDLRLTDAELKQRLLELAKSGAPRPSRNSVLGRALERFTTRPQ